MKGFIIILQLLSLFYINEAKNERKWLEINQDLYLVEPKAKYTWQEAINECKKNHSTLITPKGDYDYALLKNTIKQHFENYASFWTDTQIKYSSIFHQIGLDTKHTKCHKFDNITSFKFVPDDCDKKMGFICKKSLLYKYSSFISQDSIYFVEPEQEFSCQHAYEQCASKDMFLLPLNDYYHYVLLRNYVFLNYGSNPNFWFSYKNETHQNCATPHRGQAISRNSKLGFICHRNRERTSEITFRHWVLIIFLAVGCIVAIAVYVFASCFCKKKHVVYPCEPVYTYPNNFKISDMKL